MSNRKYDYGRNFVGEYHTTSFGTQNAKLSLYKFGSTTTVELDDDQMLLITDYEVQLESSGSVAVFGGPQNTTQETSTSYGTPGARLAFFKLGNNGGAVRSPQVPIALPVGQIPYVMCENSGQIWVRVSGFIQD